MNYLKKSLSFLGIVLFGTYCLASDFSSSNKVSADDGVLKTSGDYGFNVNAEEPETFKVVALASNSTSTSHSLSLKFSSSTSYLKNTTSANYKGVFIASEDPNCQNDVENKKLIKYDFDPNSPNYAYVECSDENHKDPVLNDDGTYNFVADEDGVTHNYKALIPTYEGYIFKLNPTENAELMVIPYIVNRFDRYKVKVNSIYENVFDFKTSSLGKQSDMTQKLKRVIIGPNVKKVATGAFKVADENVDKIELDFVGEESSIEFGENWTNLTNVHFNYSVDSLDANATTIKEIKNIYEMGVEKDTQGNPVYYDDLGYIIDADGNYLKVTGKEKYEGEPQTHDGAKVIAFNYTDSQSAADSFVFGDQNSSRPMVLEYKVQKADNTIETRYYEFPFDEDLKGVGNLAGKKEQLLYADFHLSDEEGIVDQSFFIRNLFKSESTSLVASTADEYSYRVIKGYDRTFDFDDFVTRTNYSIESFGEYTGFSMNLDKVEGIYELVNPVSYASYKSKIENGSIKIRYSFTGFNTSTYRITFLKNNQLVTKEISFNDSSDNGITLNFHLLTSNKNNVVTFLIKNSLVDESFSANSVRRLEYKALSFKLDLMNTKKGTTQIVTKSDVVCRFGYYDILPEQSASYNFFDGVAFVIVGAAIYIALFTAYTFLYFVYAKKAYKNDEFRRIDNKKYFKKMAMILAQGLLVVLGILFTIVRFGFFNTSVIVYNPVDPFVIIFDIIAIIIVGIFIKNLTILAKANKARKEALRLKLNDDVTEDGTN